MKSHTNCLQAHRLLICGLISEINIAAVNSQLHEVGFHEFHKYNYYLNLHFVFNRVMFVSYSNLGDDLKHLVS